MNANPSDSPFNIENALKEPTSTGGKVVAADGHVYHKSKSANATVAPTNEATIAKVTGAGLSSEDLQLITICDYEWNLNGNLEINRLCEEYGFTSEELSDRLQSELVLSALEERGILRTAVGAVLSVPEADPITKIAKLSPLQLVAANKILDLTDSRSDRKKLQDMGITSTQYNAWMRNPEFSSYLQKRAESMLGDTQHLAMLALMDKVNSRDVNAIKYYHALTGRFTEATSRDVGNNSGDLQNIVIRIIEIVIDEVDDPDTAARIADRLQGLITGAAVAGSLMQTGNSTGPIIQPEVATPREITPAVKVLMDQGVGYDG